MKVMNEIAMRPTVMNAIPSPLRPFGTCEYAIFSLIAANVTIARNQPTPEPRAYTRTYQKFTKSLSAMKSEPPRIAQFTAMSGRKIPNCE